ncbi:glycosyl transferase family group 2-domain-containing protein [Blyttiomyces helicus]|uniref:Glycosyl transferase family group 2-domain-containing protein n=1 Tax=Blyttiomyces helicus TaxID=388810 RepID=A0A4P9W2L3_9FUNG|nr:glycosyl transferase family group 2-domain-containing protein [Blyttiomyces helicus]|eukprot:RKO85615.1 glycosyl transferase family group 2-domain-containing protein [Blyttiomyces helicus]
MTYASPTQMDMSNFLWAFCAMLFIEISYVSQWLFSSAPLTFLGKTTFGFYVLQMTVIYTIMPKILLHVSGYVPGGLVGPADPGYYNNFWVTYVTCLIITIALGYVFYKTIDEWSLKFARWLWSELFETQPNTLTALPGKLFNQAVDGITKGPGNAGRSFKAGYLSFCKTWARRWHTVTHWRNPTVRPLRMQPEQPDQEWGQMHSTEWTADLSGDPEARRTERLLRFNSCMWFVNMVGIPGLAWVWFTWSPIGKWEHDWLSFGVVWRIFWVFSVPWVLLAYFGFCFPRIAHSKEYQAKRPVFRKWISNLYIVIVSQGSNEMAVRRSYDRMKLLTDLHPAVKVVVLTDEPYVFEGLPNMVCPKDYTSPLGLAKHKARALDYFRSHTRLNSYDWVLHMDEESSIDAESLRRCFEFIRYEKHDFGQGIILYNAYNYWKNWVFTVADAIRVGDDLGRFNLQFSLVQRPVFGIHGSFLMTSGDVENENTWDFGSLVEDFEFSQAAWAKGFTCGAIHGIVREQSPGSLRDFMKQRRRWYMGIREIEGMYSLPAIALKLWTMGIFTLVATLVNIPFSFFLDQSYTPEWIAICSTFCFVAFYWTYLWGVIFSDLDAGMPWYWIIIHVVCSIVIQPFASMCEGFAVVWAIGSENTGAFEVIKK